ncbi:predicted protein [Chaetomium globosum CBS 148.51]|uniref:Uncharacterized protein n=1 Tax=Chaetomium globosum (strain ATCC 6205 / CBS 148.51 / DSM 1962 / NBRC 6347 / NRRL 1970) TaxID=306901 RepID=Q2GRN1_CHAGB|nr:uncharacterized protein CHGG_09373 [Chaetomium globosum CBS 148.51]EAQ85359.1 predicted protein [Chaetomium globosum CBS 148.51]
MASPSDIRGASIASVAADFLADQDQGPNTTNDHPVEDDEADDGDFCNDNEDGNDDFFEEMEGNEDDDTVPFIAPTLYVCDLQD